MRRPLRRLCLTPQHLRNHLDWCRIRSSWLQSGRHCIVFRDVFHFTLESDDHKVWKLGHSWPERQLSFNEKFTKKALEQSSSEFALSSRAGPSLIQVVCLDKDTGEVQKLRECFAKSSTYHPEPTKFTKYNKMLLGSTKDACYATMKDAVEEAVQENQNIRDIPVAVDGTWPKRGYFSMNAVMTVKSVDTGKVIDTKILSKHRVCNIKGNIDRNARRTSTGIVDERKSMELY
ncbi:uncharacterized protein TNCV_4410131 [Trichonephila clavipes]|nr:uncharacterized protein TNCV_4410131 [Trichonephila clavipes]